jgi:hypothetical protein
MRRFAIPPDAKKYVDALRSLIRPGVHACQSLSTSCLVDLPIVTVVSSHGLSAEEKALAFIDGLERVVAKRLHGRDRSTASILFALGEYAGMSARDRYALVADLHGHRGSRKWDAFRKEPLDRHLMAVFLAIYREGEELVRQPVGNGGRSVEEPFPTQRPTRISGGDYILRSREVLYNFPTREGAPREVVDRREIEATHDGVIAWRQTMYYWGRGTTRRPAVTLFGPGVLSIERESAIDRISPPGRAYLLALTFAEPLLAGQRVRFTLHWSHEVRLADIVRDRYHDGWRMAPNIPTELFSVGVRFPETRRPKSVWHYEHIPEAFAPGVPTESNSLELGSDAYVSFTWSALLVGYAYGLEWEW